MLEGPTPCRSDLPAWWIHQLASTRFAHRRLAFAQQRRIPACIGFAQPGRRQLGLPRLRCGTERLQPLLVLAVGLDHAAAGIQPILCLPHPRIGQRRAHMGGRRRRRLQPGALDLAGHRLDAWIGGLATGFIA